MVRDLTWLRSWLLWAKECCIAGARPEQMPITVDDPAMDRWLEGVKGDDRFSHLRQLRAKAIGGRREYPAGHLHSLYQHLKGQENGA